MPEKLDFKNDSKLEKLPLEPPVEEVLVETEEPETAPKVEDAVVKVSLSPEYDGPEPVYVSTVGHDRLEVTSEGIEVPAKDQESFLSLPYVEVVA